LNGAGGRFWTDEEVGELRKRWDNRPPGQNKSEFAQGYALGAGRSINSVLSKVKTLEVTKSGGVPVSRYEAWDSPPSVEGDVLILGDCHIPYHDAEFLDRCLSVAAKMGITQLILAGDALDARAFSRWPEDFGQENGRVISSELEKDLLDAAQGWPKKQREQLIEKLAEAHRDAGDVREEIVTSREVLKAIAAQFESVLWIMGNHEAWVIKTLQKALPADEFASLFHAGGSKWRISPYYYANVMSNGEPYQVEHPKNSGKGSSKRLVPKFGVNIVMLHNHHLSLQSDPSGRWLAIEPGMCADEKRAQYVQQRHNTADEHVTGALIIRNGKAILLNRFTDWELLG